MAKTKSTTGDVAIPENEHIPITIYAVEREPNGFFNKLAEEMCFE